MTVFYGDLPDGTVVRLFSSGLEGIIVGRSTDTSRHMQYIIELRHGDTASVAPNLLAPADSPVHKLLEDWNAEGKRNGFEGLVIGADRDGKWHPFFVGGQVTYNSIVKQNQHLKFMYYWRLRS
ncbi:MAG TPA: hypothetical protein VGK59_23775 [Ohtaekwangia sp.]